MTVEESQAEKEAILGSPTAKKSHDSAEIWIRPFYKAEHDGELLAIAEELVGLSKKVVRHDWRLWAIAVVNNVLIRCS